MAELLCKEMDCHVCCQWGDMADTMKPDPTLIALENGDCANLIRGVGCKLHGTGLKPVACQTFDCRELIGTVMDNPFIRVIIAAIRLQMHTTAKTGKKGIIHDS